MLAAWARAALKSFGFGFSAGSFFFSRSLFVSSRSFFSSLLIRSCSVVLVSPRADLAVQTRTTPRHARATARNIAMIALRSTSRTRRQTHRERAAPRRLALPAEPDAATGREALTSSSTPVVLNPRAPAIQQGGRRGCRRERCRSRGLGRRAGRAGAAPCPAVPLLRED